jgi:20S proteasome subunit beta 7
MDVTKFGSLWQYGPVPGEFYNFPSARVGGLDVLTKYQHDSQRNSGPITTGTSVIGMAYKDGVIVAADNLVSYGSLARYRNCDRVIKVNDKIVLGCGGDYADFQFIRAEIEQKAINDLELKDNNELKPRALYNWMTTFLYNRRCEMKPLYVDLIIGGINDVNEPDEKPFLGHVSIRGKAYKDDVIATGFGSHLALPIMREFLQKKENDIKNITQKEAQDTIKKCMEVLYYRDCRAYSRFSEGLVYRADKNIMVTLESKMIEENWNVAKLIKGYN